jgi:hypothetical protein
MKEFWLVVFHKNKYMIFRLERKKKLKMGEKGYRKILINNQKSIAYGCFKKKKKAKKLLKKIQSTIAMTDLFNMYDRLTM